jgi:hypothetical protein
MFNLQEEVEEVNNSLNKVKMKKEIKVLISWKTRFMKR